MNALSSLRAELWAALDGTGFLRRDRTAAALFISDYPRRCADSQPMRNKLESAGFSILETDGLWAIDLSRARWDFYLSSIPLCPLPPPRDETLPLLSLAKRLIRADTPVSLQPLAPIRLTLLALETGQYSRLAAALPPILSELLRTHQPMPTAAGRLIAQALRADEEEASCC